MAILLPTLQCENASVGRGQGRLALHFFGAARPPLPYPLPLSLVSIVLLLCRTRAAPEALVGDFGRWRWSVVAASRTPAFHRPPGGPAPSPVPGPPPRLGPRFPRHP